MTDAFKNSLESSYARHLDALKDAGEITAWEYEPHALVIDGGNTVRGQHYTPDFLVEYPDGHREYHETKGYFYEQDRVRTYQAAARYIEIRFYIISRKRGQWKKDLIRFAWEKHDKVHKQWEALQLAAKRNRNEYLNRSYAYADYAQAFLDAHPKFHPDYTDKL